MKQLSFTFTIILTLATSLFSQNIRIGTELSEIRKNKNHLDLDVKNVFNGLTGATMLYKRSFQTGDLIEVNSIKLLRLSASFSNQNTFTDEPMAILRNNAFSGVTRYDYSFLNLAIGFERQKMHKLFVHYYGIDGIFHREKTGTFTGTTSYSILDGELNDLRTVSDRFVRTIKAGINPFFGIKFYFTDRISIGIETGFYVYYFNQKSTGRAYYYNNGVLEFQTGLDDPVIKTHGIQARFNNLRYLTIGYTF